MAEENLGEIYVKIRADVSGLEKELTNLKRKIDKESKENQTKLDFKAKFDTSIAKLRLSELQSYRQKLQREFDKKISLNVDSASLDRTRLKIASVDQQLQGVGKSAQSFGSKLLGGLTAIGGIAAFFKVIKDSVDAAKESAIAQAQITKAVETTGQSAGFTAKQLFKMAEELQKLNAIDDDKILTDVTNNLLTFKNVSGDAFKRAQQAILDLNAVISKGELGSLTSQTIQLGKALNAPTEGVTALTRVGVSFTEQQKAQIKTLEQSGKLFEAQSLILTEIEGQYGGQAEALANATGGMQQFSVTVGNLLEKLGAPLLSVLGKVATAISSLLEPVENVNEGFIEQKKTLDDLQKSVTPLLSRYDELKSKTSLNKIEQDELRTIILRVASAIPSAISALDDYGVATDINRGKVEEFIKTEQKRLAVVNKADIEAFNKKKSLAEQNKKLLEFELNQSLKSGKKKVQFSTAQGVIETEVKISDQEIQSAQQKIKAFQDEIDGYNAQLDLLSGKVDEVKPVDAGKTVLDTTAGDEVLKQYQEQQQAIEQIRNKLKDVNLTTSERIELQKALDGLLKDKTITTKFESQIPSGYTAQQVAEFEKLKFAIQGYVDFRTAQIENTYKQEIDKAKGNAVEIAKAEENKILAVARFNQEMIELQKEGSDATNKIVIDSLKEREKELESDLEREAQLEADNFTKRQDALKNFYDQSSVLSENYFQYKIQKLAEESAALLEATGDPLIAKQLEIEGMKALEQEYFDWKVEMWRQQAGIFAASLDGLAAGYDTFWQSLANADITGAERIQQVWDAIKNAVLQSVGEIIKGYILNMIQAQVVGDALKAAELGKGIALGGSLAAAYAPAAAFASIMSFGGAAAAGSAGLVTTVALARALAIPSFSKGGDFIVPGGYPNDSYPMLVESGERVTVTPSGQSGPGGLSGGDVDRIVNAIKAMNMNLIDKDFSIAVVNNSPDVKTTVRRGEKIKTQLTRQGAKLSEG